MKRLTSIFIAMICALTLLTPAVAYAAIDEELSNLTVVMNYGGEKLGGINVSICRVADAKEVSGGIVYDTTPAFSGAGADFTNLTEAKNIAQAASLNTYAFTNNIARTAKVTDGDGKAVFNGLPAGMYLVAQLDAETSEYIIAPYLTAIPVPSMTKTGEWNYNVTAYPKTEPIKRNTEKINIIGTKSWYHHIRNTNQYVPENQRPRSITLLLYADGELILQKTITAADNWYWSVEVDKYAEDGHEIVYTVDESVIYNYRKWVIVTTDGYNIINEYSPGDNTEDIPDVPPPLGPPDEGPDVPYTRDFPEDGPKTNDDSNMQLWIMLIVAGSIGLLAVLIIMNSKRFTRILPRK